MWPWLNTRSHFRINHALHELGINHRRNCCSVSISQSDCNGIFISSTINNISTGARSLPRSVCLAARLAVISRRVILRCSEAVMEGLRCGTKRDLLAQVPQVRGQWGSRRRKMGVAWWWWRGGDPRKGDKESLACFHTLATRGASVFLVPY